MRAMGALALLALTLMAFSVAGSGAAPASAPAEIGYVDTTPASTTVEADGPDCRDVAAMIQRASQAIRGMEARIQDLQVKQDRLVQALRAVDQEMQDLQAKLDRIENEYKQLEAEKLRLIQIVRDPNSSQQQKDDAMKRIREIEAKQADLRAAAKRIHDRLGQLRLLEARLTRELMQTHRQINVLLQRLDDAKHLLHRLVTWYRANCP